MPSPTLPRSAGEAGRRRREEEDGGDAVRPHSRVCGPNGRRKQALPAAPASSEEGDHLPSFPPLPSPGPPTLTGFTTHSASPDWLRKPQPDSRHSLPRACNENSWCLRLEESHSTLNCQSCVFSTLCYRRPSLPQPPPPPPSPTILDLQPQGCFQKANQIESLPCLKPRHPATCLIVQTRH